MQQGRALLVATALVEVVQCPVQQLSASPPRATTWCCAGAPLHCCNHTRTSLNDQCYHPPCLQTCWRTSGMCWSCGGGIRRSPLKLWSNTAAQRCCSAAGV